MTSIGIGPTRNSKKKSQSDEISQMTREYLRKGGKITQVESSVERATSRVWPIYQCSSREYESA